MAEILAKLFDALLGGLLARRRQNKALAEELERLKRGVLYVGLANNVPLELHRLRTFLIEHDLVERPGIRRFFARWLTLVPVVIGLPALNVFTSETLLTLHADLRALRL